MNKQVSTDPMVQDETVVAQLPSTSIPIREEFRVRRLWFFYHDLRAFTTSWIPLPIFVIIRLLVFLYALMWLILHINARRDPRYLILITNLSYTILVFSLGSIAALTLGYTIVYYTRRERLDKYFPKQDSSLMKIYSQDNIKWYVKICWVLYIIGASQAFTAVGGYYVAVIDYTCSNDDNDMMNSTAIDAGNTTQATTTTAMSFCNSIDTVDVYSAHVHGVNALLVLIDLFLSRFPYQLFHFFYILLFSVPYVIFTLIYYAAGGTNESGGRYIYRNLNYAEPESAGLAIVLIIVPMPFFLVLFLLGWLRDVIYKRIGYCFRDIHQGQEVSVDEEKDLDKSTDAIV